MMRSRQSLHELPSNMHSPSEEEEPDSERVNGYEEELRRGRVSA